MESVRLSHILENTYIPKPLVKHTPKIPLYHPCLIMQDKQTGTTNLKPCGCPDVDCIIKASKWIPKPK